MNHPPAFIAEQHVQLAARHFIRRGDVVYDVGANRGWLTVSFSRLVGMHGGVACFEASPRNIRILSSLVSEYRLANVEVAGIAVYQESGLTVDLFENPFSNTDSLYFKSGEARPTPVRTLSLDDFHACTGLRPSVVKMDIEGAEYDALVGGAAMVEAVRPIFLMEMRKDDLRPFHFLCERGYRAFNLKTFEAMDGQADFEASGIVEDILFIHEERLSEPEAAFLATAAQQTFTSVAVEMLHADKMVLCNFPVEPGITCVRVYSRATGRPNVACSVLSGGRCVVRSDAGYYLICEPHLSFTVFSEKASTATICVEVTSDDPGMEILRVETKTIPLDAASHKHHTILNLLQPFGTPTEQIFPLLDWCVNNGHTAAFEMIASHIRLSDPNHPRFLYLSGVNALHAGRMEEALGLFDQALLLGFDVFWIQYMRTSALRSLGRLAEARDAAARAEEASPGQPNIQRMLAELDKSMGR